MAEYKTILNPYSGKLILVPAETMFHVKDPVDTYNDLPITGNTENDARFVKDTDLLYVWSISSPNGSLSDWKELGAVGPTGPQGETGPTGPAGTTDHTLLTNKNVEVDIKHTTDNQKDAADNADNPSASNPFITESRAAELSGITYVEDETESTTTDNVNWQQKLRLNFTPSEIGDYWFHWAAEIANDGANKGTEVQVELDDINQLNFSVNAPIVADGYANIDGFKKVNFVDTNLHTIDIDFKSEGSGTAKIRRVRMAIRRV